MKVIIQRVSEANVSINKVIKSSIEKGYLILVGFENEDNQEDLVWIANKISNLRIFSDTEGKMNLSIKDIQGEILLISQFTLFASTKKGNRPSFMKSAKPEIAIPLYEHFIKRIKLDSECKVVTGKFGAHMDIELENNGPVTIIIDSKNRT